MASALTLTALERIPAQHDDLIVRAQHPPAVSPPWPDIFCSPCTENARVCSRARSTMSSSTTMASSSRVLGPTGGSRFSTSSMVISASRPRSSRDTRDRSGRWRGRIQSLARFSRHARTTDRSSCGRSTRRSTGGWSINSSGMVRRGGPQPSPPARRSNTLGSGRRLASLCPCALCGLRRRSRTPSSVIVRARLSSSLCRVLAFCRGLRQRGRVGAARVRPAPRVRLLR